MAALISSRACLIHGASGAQHYFGSCPACDAFYRATQARTTDGGNAASDTSPKAENSTMAHNLNKRANVLIETLELNTIPELAERLGVGKTALYAALKADRDGADLPDDSVLAAIVALEDETNEGAEDEEQAEDEEATEEEDSEDAGEDEDEDEAEEEVEEEEEVEAPAPKAKAKAKAPKAKAPKPAKPAKAEKPVTIPASKDDAPFSTGGRMQVLDKDGSDKGLRSVYAPRIQEDGSFTGHVVISARVFNVVAKKGLKAGGSWTITGEKLAKLAQPKAAPKAKAEGTAKPKAAAPAAEVKAAPKPGKKK